ncbi:MAG TPA: 4'-phosphopantetheinyl transferase superfamily protein [Mucilaginibacter sp.]|jgi:4'-phosphopantetheinyl transferase|nr:4'-phosphopantetheinyl transferase superfamily protein [Mucilaginibacter sp.]
MMIICCYTEIAKEWTERELTEKLLLLPASLHQAILRKRQWMDRQLSIGGKLLLTEALKQLGKKNMSLADIKYNSHHRPYFETDLDFNIAHSGNIVVCCATDSGQIGIDIEQIKEIDLADYADYFTPNEWGIINDSSNRFDGSYDFWTRKEAVLKAIGTGFHTPLSSVDVSDDEIKYDGITYHIRSLQIADGYKSHIAATIKPEDVRPIKVNL